MIDSNRTSSGGYGLGIKLVYVPMIDTNDYTDYYITDPLVNVIESSGGLSLMELYADGTEKEIYTTFAAETGSGCPLCGTMNWR